MIPINLLLQMMQNNQRDAEEPDNSDKQGSRQAYEEAQGLRLKYDYVFSAWYTRSNPAIVLDYLHAVIHALYIVNPFTEVLYNKHNGYNNNETINVLLFKFKDELPNDGTMMSGIINEFEKEFSGNWIMGKSPQHLYVGDYKDSVICYGEEDKWFVVGKEIGSAFPRIEVNI